MEQQVAQLPKHLKPHSPQWYAAQRRLFLKEALPEEYAERERDGSLHSHLSSIGQEASDHFHTTLSRLQTSPETQNLPYHQKAERLQSLPAMANELAMNDVVRQERAED